MAEPVTTLAAVAEPRGDEAPLTRAGRFSTRQSLLLVVPLLVLLGVFFVTPIVKLTVTSLTGEEGRGYGALVGDPLVQRAFLRTGRIALEVTVATLVLGYFTAYAMWKSPRGLQVLLVGVVMFPLLTSVILRNYAWTAILSTNGALNRTLDWLGFGSVNLLNTEAAVLIGMVQVMLPYAVLPIWTVLERLDPSLYRSSLSLGAGPVRTFRHVIFPLSLPGVAVATVMVFIVSLGFYVTPALLGGPRNMMVANVIDQQVNQFLDFRAGAALAFMLLVLTLGTIVLAYRLFRVDRLLRETS